MRKLLITICARGGSKGLPDKNIRLLNGKPLIGYSIERAFDLKSHLAGSYDVDIVLSTDSDKISNVAGNFGLRVPYMRPAYLATDDAGKLGAIRDVLNFKEKAVGSSYDFVLDLDVTSPFRTLLDLTKSLDLIENNIEAFNLFSVSLPHRNPYFNMVEEKLNGYVKLVKPLEKAVLSRQAAPRVYDMNASFYIYRRSFFKTSLESAITDKSMIYLMPHLCFDVDHEIDFTMMEFLIIEKKLDFEFK